MIIYKCIISEDEMFSDIFPIKETAIFYEVEGKVVTTTSGDIDDSLIGGNASTEEQAETTDVSVTSGVNIVLYSKLQETTYDKKSYLAHIKAYLKSIKAKMQETNPERVEQFMLDANNEVKKLLQGGFKDLQFFIGESLNTDGMVAILDYREDNVTPFMRFFKDGVRPEKC
ncbi:translationally-controlled tumor protein homolog [Hippocampus comes]|uniref:translationally-controlled tumor protein homolog n=1 Tax=Hippocampus comes TaxID=109280 RepID=UPI00094EDD6F|nr:PREDICTED: translationally-controlled tumor protein [Hippocampus comes]